jgi:DNA-binding IclR family transcriptional regulator
MSLGPKLLELGYETARQMELPRVASEYLEALSASTVWEVVYLDKITGSRRVNVCSAHGSVNANRFALRVSVRHLVQTPRIFATARNVKISGEFSQRGGT